MHLLIAADPTTGPAGFYPLALILSEAPLNVSLRDWDLQGLGGELALCSSLPCVATLPHACCFCLTMCNSEGRWPLFDCSCLSCSQRFYLTYGAPSQIFGDADLCKSNTKTQSHLPVECHCKGRWHGWVFPSPDLSAPVVPHTPTSMDDKDNLCSRLHLFPLWSLPWVKLAGSILALCVGRYPFLCHAACRSLFWLLLWALERWAANSCPLQFSTAAPFPLGWRAWGSGNTVWGGSDCPHATG